MLEPRRSAAISSRNAFLRQHDTNAIKSAEQGTGLGLPIAKNLIDLHGGTFTLKSKLRFGTEVIVTFQPERVMSALGPFEEPSPPIQPSLEPGTIRRRAQSQRAG